jgi:hypothetical protein
VLESARVVVVVVVVVAEAVGLQVFSSSGSAWAQLMN